MDTLTLISITITCIFLTVKTYIDRLNRIEARRQEEARLKEEARRQKENEYYNMPVVARAFVGILNGITGSPNAPVALEEERWRQTGALLAGLTTLLSIGTIIARPPSSQAPSSQVHSSQAPSSQAPSSQAPSSQAPSSQLSPAAIAAFDQAVAANERNS